MKNKFKIGDYVGVKSYEAVKDKNGIAHFTDVSIIPGQIVSICKYQDLPYRYRIYFANSKIIETGYLEETLIPLTKEAYDVIYNDENIENINDIELDDKEEDLK